MIIAAVALIFASDLVIWHVLPQSFGFSSSCAFYLGSAFSLFAIAFAVSDLIKKGKSKAAVLACMWSIAEFCAFGFIYLYASFSA